VNLAALIADPLPPAVSVPAWTLGCFRRRSITFFTGACDAATTVFWLQSPGLTADLRLPAQRPKLAAGTLASLGDAAPDLLQALADCEGGLARTGWDGQAMSWSDWTAFALHDKWPEPGRLARVGDCLIEHAPSGAYVEDWRLLPSRPGPLVGLRLIEERNLASGLVTHRGGGLVVCGDHAALVLGRPAPLPVPPGARLDEVVRARLEDRAFLHAVFAFEASVGCVQGDTGEDHTVIASTNPLREGQPLGIAGDFSRVPGDARTVIQRIATSAGPIERRFHADSWQTGFARDPTTTATPAAAAWLQREGRTLLASARPSTR
jgi:hypothetical protein